ncbi:glycerophosphodiester phosphodiesterase [Clostridium sp. DJ247]|uniref:glycerophosphodiester phosphodiesterase n=1 Tax=Clostridium sp. DJ247 TaxID=2726188 RepID=UPI001625AD5C|nr:glycerophosphodiester phosphodiesterase [Clostridium sp. DJ247]MBC2581502.1 glycerophosphodiester phosphodiesterase [Clostridium sp. DJ247]
MISENRINITAHAGCMGTTMDSIEAVEVGIKYGAHIIEIDLNIDESGNLVISHDKPKVEVKYSNVDEVLEIIKKEQEVLLNIDIKDAKLLGKLNRTILEYGIKDRVFFTGIDFQCILDNEEALRGTNYFINLGAPKLDITQLNNKEYLIELFNELESLNIMGINVNYRLVTPEIINVCKEKRMLSSVWTVDDIQDMKRMINLNVSSITTKRVDVLKSLISEISNNK